jgi:transposase
MAKTKPVLLRLIPVWEYFPRFEAFTSKTHAETGEVKKVGSAKRIQLLNGQWINRDIVGARNILLRALVDQPHVFTWQLGNVSNLSIS